MNLWCETDDADDNGLKDKDTALDDNHSHPSHKEFNKRGLLLLPLQTSLYQTSGQFTFQFIPQHMLGQSLYSCFISGKFQVSISANSLNILICFFIVFMSPQGDARQLFQTGLNFLLTRHFKLIVCSRPVNKCFITSGYKNTIKQPNIQLIVGNQAFSFHLSFPQSQYYLISTAKVNENWLDRLQSSQLWFVCLSRIQPTYTGVQNLIVT